jgi:hypothetical protein
MARIIFGAAALVCLALLANEAAALPGVRDAALVREKRAGSARELL